MSPRVVHCRIPAHGSVWASLFGCSWNLWTRDEWMLGHAEPIRFFFFLKEFGIWIETFSTNLFPYMKTSKLSFSHVSHLQFFQDPMDCRLPVSPVQEISQARILEWAAIFFFRGSSWPRDQTCGSWLAGKFFTTEPPGKPGQINFNLLE